MTKKEEFIDYVESLMKNQKKVIEMSENAKIYWEALKNEEEKNKPLFTDNGKMILKYLKELPEGTPLLKAKEIAEGMYLSSRTVSGSIRKLVSDGYVEKIGQNPVMYSLTELGKNIDIDIE